MKGRPDLLALVRSACRSGLGAAKDGRDWFVRLSVLMWFFVILCLAYRAFFVGALLAVVAGLISTATLFLERRAIITGKPAAEATQRERGRQAWAALPLWQKAIYIGAGILGTVAFGVLRWLERF